MGSIDYSTASPSANGQHDFSKTTAHTTVNHSLRYGSGLKGTKYGKFIIQSIDQKQTSTERYDYYMGKLNDEEK